MKPKIKPSEITPKSAYLNRRQILAAMFTAPAFSALPAMATADLSFKANAKHTMENRGYVMHTPKDKALSYNNFYELGTGKHEPAENADRYQSSPWRIAVEGEVQKPREFDTDDLLALAPLEERFYRLRCVEAWSMVIPWIGFSLNHLIRAVQPTGNAKYIQFLTFNPEDLFPRKSNSSLPWPYSEGLRLDEAMHPLTMLVFGMYGEKLMNQNGAPVRMMIPWKYGFKSGKAIVKIVFTEKKPVTTWNILQPSEYGFYANVNPQVSHPRWSQATEKAIGDSFFPERRPTDMFNGFGEEVASLYSDMDLTKHF